MSIPQALNSDFIEEYQQLTRLSGEKRYMVKVKDGEPFMPGGGGRGRIEPYSVDGQTLAAFTSRPGILRQLLALPYITPHQVGQHEGSVLFPIARFQDMADFLRLKRKPTFSAEQLESRRQRMTLLIHEQNASNASKNQRTGDDAGTGVPPTDLGALKCSQN